MDVLSAWWLCPNRPRCPHGAVLHDVDDYDDPRPTCCIEGCPCGKPETPAYPPVSDPKTLQVSGSHQEAE